MNGQLQDYGAASLVGLALAAGIGLAVAALVWA